MTMDFSKLRITLLLAPVDMRAGFYRLAVLARSFILMLRKEMTPSSFFRSDVKSRNSYGQMQPGYPFLPDGSRPVRSKPCWHASAEMTDMLSLPRSFSNSLTESGCMSGGNRFLADI